MAIDFHWGSFFDIADPCSIKDSGHIDNLYRVLWLQLANKFFFKIMVEHHTAKSKILWFDHYTQMFFLD